MRLLRSHQWWNYKVPPMLAIAYCALALGADRPSAWHALAAIALFLVSVIGIAGFGHVFTDAFDVAEDRVHKSANAWARLSIGARATLMIALLAASWLPWLAPSMLRMPNVLPVAPATLALLGFEFALFAFYAVPPFRLKERGLLGIVADGLYAHAVPALVTALTFSRLARFDLPAWTLALLATWALTVGMRHLLNHQALDAERDRAAGVRTFAVRRGRIATLRLIAHRVLPVELVTFLTLVALLSMRLPAVALGAVVYMAWEAYKLRRLGLQRVDLFGRMEAQDRVRIVGTPLLSRFYERWLPVLMLAALVAREPAYITILAGHLVLFENAVSDVLSHDLPLARAALLRRSAESVR